MAQLLRRLSLTLVLLLAACTMPYDGMVLRGPLPPQPPGTARLVLYRPLTYYDTTAMTTVYFNGAPVGVSQVGSVFYRDVAPGQYDISVWSPGVYPNQFKSVVVAAGDSFYARIDTLPKPPCAIPRVGGECADTFIVTVVDPISAREQIQGLHFLASQSGPMTALLAPVPLSR